MKSRLQWVRGGLKRGKDRLVSWLKAELGHVPRWLWLLSLVPWAVFSLWLWLYPFPVKDDLTPFLYLLSALSQGMAAVLALTFSISLVAAQLTTRYSSRLLERLLSLPTILYIMLFALAVVLPLVLLPSPAPVGVKLSLSWGALALALLIPYFRYFLWRITPRALLEDLSREAEKKLRAGQEAPEIETIDNMAMSAFGFKDYDTFSVALEKLAPLALVQESGEKEPRPELYREGIWDRMQDISLTVMDDPRAAWLDIEALEHLAVAAAGKRLEKAAERAARSLGVVGRTAVEKGLETTAWQAAHSLGLVGLAAAQKGTENAASGTATSLGLMGEAAVQKGLGYTACMAATSLGKVGVAAAQKGLETAAHMAAYFLGIVGEAAAQKEGLEETAKGVTSSLGDVGIAAAQKGLEAGARVAASSLGVVGLAAANKRLQTDAIRAVARKGLEETAKGAASSLGDVGEVSAQKGLGIAAREAADCLGEVGMYAAQKGLGDVATIAAVSLKKMAKAETGREVVTTALEAMAVGWKREALDRFISKYAPELQGSST